MASETSIHIEERTRQAAEHRSGQGVLGRAVSGTGLFIANTWDRITAPFTSDKGVFARGTVMGAVRGAVLGAIVGIIAIPILSTGGAASAVAISFFWAATGIGAVIGGIRDGQSKLETHWHHNRHRLADDIARKTGAIGAIAEHKPLKTSVPQDAGKLASSDLQQAKPSDEKYNTPGDSLSHVEREQLRRAGRGPIELH